MRVRARQATLAGVALLLTACGGGSGTGATTKQVPATTFACPDVHSRIDPTPGPARLPSGATAALLCRRPNGLVWLPPAGALTHGLPALIHLVDSRHATKPDPHQVCDADLGFAYAIVLRYPDGLRTITAEAYGCRQIEVGSTVRPGAKALLRAYLHALARQRAHSSPPAGRQRIRACITPRIPPASPDSQPAHLADARLCARHGSRFVRHGRPLDHAQLGALRHDLASAGHRVLTPRPGQHYCRAPMIKGPVRVSAVDRWGDRFVVDIACDLYRYAKPTPHAYLVHLLPRTARLLARH